MLRTLDRGSALSGIQATLAPFHALVPRLLCDNVETEKGD
jgi:hypothetical protein